MGFSVSFWEKVSPICDRDWVGLLSLVGGKRRFQGVSFGWGF